MYNPAGLQRGGWHRGCRADAATALREHHAADSQLGMKLEPGFASSVDDIADP